MDAQPGIWTLGWIAATLGGELHGPPEKPILRPVSASTNDPDGIAFCEAEKYVREAEAAGVGAALIGRTTPALSIPFVRVDHPRLAFGALLAMAARPLPLVSGVHPMASISDEADVDPTASIGAFAVVERGAKIGPRAAIYAFAYVGELCRVGADAKIFPHAVLYQDVEIGDRSVVHAGAVIGADGFGYVWDGQKRVKVPQVGGVRIGTDVEIGALSAIDRATAGDTAIERGTKIDNLVQIAHNVRVGEDCAIASQTGIAGSSTIGDRVVMGGQSAVGDHLSVASDTAFAGRSGIADNIDEAGQYLGYPARPWAQAMRSLLLGSKLPELVARLRRLERRMDDERID